MKCKLALLYSLIFLLSACASPEANTSFQAKFNFAELKSYSLYERNSDFAELQNLSDSMRNGIELVIEQNFDSKGYDYQNVEQADIVVGYYLVSRSKRELAEYNQGVKYCFYCLTSQNPDQNNRKDKSNTVVLGSLIIDFIDTSNKRSIWRSSYPLDIDEDDNSRQVQDKINAAVAIMFNDLPAH